MSLLSNEIIAMMLIDFSDEFQCAHVKLPGTLLRPWSALTYLIFLFHGGNIKKKTLFYGVRASPTLALWHVVSPETVSFITGVGKPNQTRIRNVTTHVLCHPTTLHYIDHPAHFNPITATKIFVDNLPTIYNPFFYVRFETITLKIW